MAFQAMIHDHAFGYGFHDADGFPAVTVGAWHHLALVWDQARGVDQINKAVGQMDQVTQQVASNSEEAASAAEELSAQAQQMNAVVQNLAALVGGASIGDGARGALKAAPAHHPAAAPAPKQAAGVEHPHQPQLLAHKDDKAEEEFKNF